MHFKAKRQSVIHFPRSMAATTCSVETFGGIVREACGTITDEGEYASLFKPFGVDEKEFRQLIGGFRRDQKLLDAEIREVAYSSKYHILRMRRPLRPRSWGSAVQSQPKRGRRVLRHLDDGTEVTMQGSRQWPKGWTGRAGLRREDPITLGASIHPILCAC